MIHLLSEQHDIRVEVKKQPYEWAPNAVIISGTIENIRDMVESINSKFGNNYLSINPNNSLSFSALNNFTTLNPLIFSSKTESISPIFF